MGNDCRYLGEQTGLRQCSTCRGGVKEKVFACQHPENGETTLRECRVCPDAWPADGPAAVSTWMIGVTTAPRETPTLRRCIESLKAAGWDDLHLFAEPATEI